MDHRDELLRAFQIDLHALETNRAGHLADSQVRKLIRSGYWNLFAVLGMGLGLGAILYGVAKKPLAPVQWLLASVLFGATAIVGILYFRRTQAAALEGRVECLSGSVTSNRRGNAGWYLVIAARTFKLTIRPWHVHSGTHYRVYYAPRANVIVAMEPDVTP
jgi:hypothetical protein